MDPDWWATIESVMRAHPGIGERLIVEITETVAIQDVDDLRSFVTRLKNFGSRIAIDDFGAGYTSFRNLRKLGVDIVKIDGAFVQNIARSADDRAFVQTLIDLARRLQSKPVAEWVQDEEAAVMLRDWGCDYIQGRLIGLASSKRPWNAPAAPALPAAGEILAHPDSNNLHADKFWLAPSGKSPLRLRAILSHQEGRLAIATTAGQGAVDADPVAWRARGLADGEAVWS